MINVDLSGGQCGRVVVQVPDAMHDHQINKKMVLCIRYSGGMLTIDACDGHWDTIASLTVPFKSNRIDAGEDQDP
jgi:hypothetical protein